MSVFPPLLVALLVLALLMRLDFVFYIVYVVGGIYLLARWWTPRGLRRLQVTRRLVDHAFLGERIAISVEVANTARLALPWLRLNETLPSGLSSLSQIKRVATVRGRETVAIDYELSCTHRGYYPIGPLRLSAGDLFGFSEVQGREEAQAIPDGLSADRAADQPGLAIQASSRLIGCFAAQLRRPGASAGCTGVPAWRHDPQDLLEGQCPQRFVAGETVFAGQIAGKHGAAQPESL